VFRSAQQSVPSTPVIAFGCCFACHRQNVAPAGSCTTGHPANLRRHQYGGAHTLRPVRKRVFAAASVSPPHIHAPVGGIPCCSLRSVYAAVPASRLRLEHGIDPPADGHVGGSPRKDWYRNSWRRPGRWWPVRASRKRQSGICRCLSWRKYITEARCWLLAVSCWLEPGPAVNGSLVARHA